MQDFRASGSEASTYQKCCSKFVKVAKRPTLNNWPLQLCIALQNRAFADLYPNTGFLLYFQKMETFTVDFFVF
jgi:hypothetical protein